MTEDDIAVTFAALRADIAALQQRVRLLESGVRPSLVPPHPEPPPRNKTPFLSGFFTARRKVPPA